ncbi:MAG TPA: hypothetical protein VD902_11205, partial [Symbiobacteriaceae bacterium]|nr:hypothetical protein [Symbiobacteriaceae bacterium]
MRPRHPWQALTYIFLVDAMALGLLYFLWNDPVRYSLVDWVSAVVFAALMAAARVMPVSSIDAQNVNYGWYMAVEFAMIAALPVPLVALAHLPGMVVSMLYRLRNRWPEPFLGPDYNVAASIICAVVSGGLLHWLIGVIGGAEAWRTMVLLPIALVFMVLQYAMLTALVCLDQRVPWYRTGLLQTDNVLGDVMMTLLGA